MRFLILDLDNTLYPKSSGMLQEIDDRIDQYLIANTGLPVEQIPRLRHQLWKEYGTTIGGMVTLYGTDPDAYLDYAYAIDVGDFIAPDRSLVKVLQGIDLTKVVFSNSPSKYVERVLVKLGIREQIAAIYDIGFCNYLGKPNSSSYQKVLADLGASGEECVFVDDTAVNVLGAMKAGMAGILLGTEAKEGIQWTIDRVHQLEELLPMVLKRELSA